MWSKNVISNSYWQSYYSATADELYECTSNLRLKNFALEYYGNEEEENSVDARDQVYDYKPFV